MFYSRFSAKTILLFTGFIRQNVFRPTRPENQTPKGITYPMVIWGEYLPGEGGRVVATSVYRRQFDMSLKQVKKNLPSDMWFGRHFDRKKVPLSAALMLVQLPKLFQMLRQIAQNLKTFRVLTFQRQKTGIETKNVTVFVAKRPTIWSLFWPAVNQIVNQP